MLLDLALLTPIVVGFLATAMSISAAGCGLEDLDDAFEYIFDSPARMGVLMIHVAVGALVVVVVVAAMFFAGGSPEFLLPAVLVLGLLATLGFAQALFGGVFAGINISIIIGGIVGREAMIQSLFPAPPGAGHLFGWCDLVSMFSGSHVSWVEWLCAAVSAVLAAVGVLSE